MAYNYHPGQYIGSHVGFLGGEKLNDMEIHGVPLNVIESEALPDGWSHGETASGGAQDSRYVFESGGNLPTEDDLNHMQLFFENLEDRIFYVHKQEDDDTRLLYLLPRDINNRHDYYSDTPHHYEVYKPYDMNSGEFLRDISSKEELANILSLTQKLNKTLHFDNVDLFNDDEVKRVISESWDELSPMIPILADEDNEALVNAALVESDFNDLAEIFSSIHAIKNTNVPSIK